MRRKLSILIVMIALLLLVAGCKKAEEESDPFFAVNVAKVEKDRLDDYLELNGDITTKNEVAVYPDTSGKIAYYTVKIGQDVKKGEIIAYIDPSRPGMTFANSPVRSPISGTITSITMKQGQTVSLQMPIAKVGKLDKIEIITYIPEKNISRIKLNQEAFVTVDAVPNKSFRAFISQMSPVVDPITRMLEIKLDVLDHKQQLKPGMFGDIKIITERKNDIIVVPTHSVIIRGDSKFAYSINSIPPYIKNVDLESKLIDKVKSSIEKDFLLTAYKIDIPETIDIFKFEKIILPGIAGLAKVKDEDKKITKDDVKRKQSLFKAFYLKNKNKGVYKLADKITPDDKEEIWKTLIDIDFTYRINVSDDLTDAEKVKLYNILLKYFYLPETVTNLELESVILDKLEDKKELILKAYKRTIPSTINAKKYKGVVLKGAKDNKLISELLNDMYIYDGKEKLYNLKGGFDDNSIYRVWNYLIQVGYSYDIEMSTGLEPYEKEELFNSLNSIDYIHFKFADKRELITGIEIDDKTEILSGIEEGEDIVTYGQSLLDDKVRVRVISSKNEEK